MTFFRLCANQWLVALFVTLSLTLTGCDQVAQKELQVGASSKDDVLVKMGKPTMIWEEKDGSALYEYPRGPEGHQTYMVKIAADGKYQGMDNILNEGNFNKVAAGMTRDDIRRQLGRPTETTMVQLKKEEMWTWKYMRNNSESRRFHVMMDAEGKVVRTEYSDDPKKQGN
jgi:outer membrane protein assembly factor BamE (lipoprotein component of BamABCDE complex)